MSDQNNDYSTGEPRHHHEFYIEDGNITIQVEKAIFRVHRYLLAQRSSVLKGMFQAPQQESCQDGTDVRPLVLSGDSVIGWEILFRSIYDTKLLKSNDLWTSDQLVALLRVAHKYCMESIEQEILSQLHTYKDKPGFFKLLDASRIVGSETLEKEAIEGLTQFRLSLTLEEANWLGMEIFYKFMMNVSSESCSCGKPVSTYCFSCSKWLRHTT